MKLHKRKVKKLFSAELGTRADIKKFADIIKNKIYTKIANLEVEAYCTPEPINYTNRKEGNKLNLKLGDSWGNLFDCAWFNFTGAIPDSAEGKCVVLEIDINGEACIVDDNGNPLGTLTTGSTVYETVLGDPGKTVWPITGSAASGNTINIWADAGNNDLFGNYHNNGSLNYAHVSIKNEEVEQLYFDYVILINLLSCLNEKSARYQKIYHALHEAMVILYEFTEEKVAEAREVLAVELARKNGDYPLHVSAIGHSHIDIAWLWPIRETIRKGARTFSNSLRMMDRFTDFIFGASQPQLYQWIKEEYPELYNQVKEKVAEGRWELLGGMWVEPDSNMVSGESFVRQFLYGKKFFKEEFGKDVKNLFMPDTFGYSAQLPQIMKGCGVEYFVTTKMSWDLYNKFPHDTFIWQALDGSEVLAHMPPEGTYNSSAAPRDIWKSEQLYEDKDVSGNMLLTYGIGNGGGGPGVEHLEMLRREKNLAGIAPVTQETVEKFFEKLEKNRCDYKRWVGELYLGLHQGTYTTQGKNKKYNRKMEIVLRNAEFFSAIGSLITEKSYPGEELEKIWKETLLYQFHDILPGSSIHRVHEESIVRYKEMLSETESIHKEALDQISKEINVKKFENPLIVWNSLSWEREEWNKHNEKWIKMNVPALGYKTIEAEETKCNFTDLAVSDSKIENKLITVSLNSDGAIKSIIDKEFDRELIYPDEQANVLTVYVDDGDAWDFSPDYRNKKVGHFSLDSMTFSIDGPKAVIKHKRKYGSSKLVQEIILTEGSKLIEFRTTVDWQENEKMLRAAFPLNIHSSESVSEIQFGHVKRPTHNNTSWELAQYEISAHKWIDLSQPDYGVALLNDCKYGYYASENILDINLLRSPTFPDPDSDRGENTFTYAILPHEGDHIVGNVIREAYEFNYPLHSTKSASGKGSLPASKSFLNVDADNIIVESVKQQEGGSGVIIRLYEAYGKSVITNINIGFDFASASETNMLEEEISPLQVDNGNIELNFKPFQIKTVCINLK